MRLAENLSHARSWLLVGALLASVGLSPINATAETDEEYGEFVRAAEAQFRTLCGRLSSERCQYWRSKESDLLESMAEFNRTWKINDGWVESHPARKEIEGLRAFDYLAQYYEREIRGTLLLSDGAGQELLEEVIARRIEPTRADLEARANNLAGIADPASLAPALRGLLKLDRKIAELRHSPPVVRSLRFAPKLSAYDRDPRLVAVFLLRDWSAATDEVEVLAQELPEIGSEVEVQERLRPRDPIAFIPLVTQLALLLIVVAGSMISFTEKPRPPVVAALVLISMGFSLLLVFMSSNTILNTLVQMVVPGVFMLIWVGWQRRRQPPSNPAG